MAGFDNDVVYANNADFSVAGAGGGSDANGLQTNGQFWIGTTSLNIGGTHVNVGTITSPLGTLSIGYSSPNITLDLAGGGLGIDSLTPNSGTTPVVPDSNGNVTLQGTGSITTVGGLNSLAPQLTGLTNHAVLVGAGTPTITNVIPSATAGIPLVSNGAAADPSFTTAVVAGGGTGRVTLTNHGVLVGAGTTAITQLAAGSAGQVLQSGGASADPAYSTPTYPSASGTSGKVLISDGTNNVYSTPTFPNASAASGKFIQSDGTNWVASTPTLPTAAGTSGTLLQSNGTNWVNTTATYPTTTTANRILYSSATNTISEITSAANSILSTDGSGIPSFGTSLNNNYTFTTSTAGVPRILTVSHTNNSMNLSHALVHVSVGDSTFSGSPFYRTAIGTSRSYCMGPSTPSTDRPWRLRTGANATVTPVSGGGDVTLMEVYPGGSVTKPLNPCVGTNLSATIANVTGDGTLVSPIIIDSELFDQNSNYNPATGLFTAPVTGKYLVIGSVTLDNVDSAHTSGELRIIAAGAVFTVFFNPAALRNSSNQCTVNINRIVFIPATNTAQIDLQVSGGTKTVGIAAVAFTSSTGSCFELIS